MIAEVIRLTDDKNPKKLQEKELTGLRKLAKRRWFYPALYLCVASLVLTGVLYFQMRGPDRATQQENRTVFNQDKPASRQSAGEEVFKWPAAKADTEVVQPFYDAKGTQQEQQAALVNYNNTYVQNTGVNIGSTGDDKTFAVTAALGGKVTEAKKDDLLGYIVTLKHDNSVTTLYQSLSQLDVKVGQKVKQGEKIGMAGTEKFNQPMGIHAHFEIRKNGVPVNPITYMDKATSAVKSVTVGSQTTVAPSASEQQKSGDSTKKTPSKDQSNSKSKSQSLDDSKIDE
jgi:stage II sporulation protein Q